MNQDGASGSEPEASTDRNGLRRFVGHWSTTGRQFEGMVGPAAVITASESYEWLEGERFLIHRFDGWVGDGVDACIEIIGAEEEGGFPVHSYYDNGMTNDWRHEARGDTWLLTGRWPMGGGFMDVRCTVEFSDDGDTMTGTWECSVYGTGWQTFWEVESERQGGERRTEARPTGLR
jgi:hypothetical protein